MEQHLQLVVLLLGLIACSAGQETQCHSVMDSCLLGPTWTRCFEQKILTCNNKQRKPIRRQGEILDASIEDVNLTNEVQKNTNAGHLIHIPAEVLRMSVRTSRTLSLPAQVRVVVTVFNSSLFQAQEQLHHSLLGNTVLQVKVGTLRLHNLSKPVNLTFTVDRKKLNGSCVFWEESDGVRDTGGRWSSDGCHTVRTSEGFVCSCYHLSFFAVLVNPGALDTLSTNNVLSLNYLTYVGCGLSVVCTSMALLLHLCMRLSGKKVRDEHSMAVHLQLMAALLLLHLFFLLNVMFNGSFCKTLGLLLHWALLATFTWMCLEGFHLYLLLVRVFNIYVRRYLLKLCIVGWGLPIFVVASCALIKPYGLLSFQAENRTDSDTGVSMSTSTTICWITNRAVQHVTVTTYLSLMFLLSATMLSIILVKLKQTGSKGTQTQQRISKRCMTLLALSCVLGVPWGLAFLTYGPLSLPSLYIFTIVNSLQGVFLFLWFCTLTWKSQAPNGSTVNYQSTRKMDSSSASEPPGHPSKDYK